MYRALTVVGYRDISPATLPNGGVPDDEPIRVQTTETRIWGWVTGRIGNQGPSLDCISALRSVSADESAYNRALESQEDLQRAVNNHPYVSENFKDSFSWQVLAAIGIRETGFLSRGEIGGGGGIGVFQITGARVSQDTLDSVEKQASWILTHRIANVYMEPVVQTQPLAVLWTLRNYNAGGRSANGRRMSLELLESGSVNAEDWDRGTAYPGLNLRKGPIDLQKGNYVSSVLRIAKHCFGDPKIGINF